MLTHRYVAHYTAVSVVNFYMFVILDNILLFVLLTVDNPTMCKQS